MDNRLFIRDEGEAGREAADPEIAETLTKLQKIVSERVPDAKKLVESFVEVTTEQIGARLPRNRWPKAGEEVKRLSDGEKVTLTADAGVWVNSMMNGSKFETANSMERRVRMLLQKELADEEWKHDFLTPDSMQYCYPAVLIRSFQSEWFGIELPDDLAGRVRALRELPLPIIGWIQEELTRRMADPLQGTQSVAPTKAPSKRS